MQLCRCPGTRWATARRCPPCAAPLRPPHPRGAESRPGSCAAGGPAGGGDRGPEDALRRLAQQAERQATRIMHTITPKQEGDAADVSLICISTLIFMWVAASLYRVYAFAFYASGQQTIGELWGG